MSRLYPRFATGAGLAAAFAAAACADAAPGAIAPPEKVAAYTAPFACGTQYTTISTVYDQDLAAYGIPEVTDTARVCQTWTGSDYRVNVQQVGSGGYTAETAPDVQSATFQPGGYVTPQTADGAALESAERVGPDAFGFGLASAQERQASYNEPYYGVYQDATPSGGGCGDTRIVCDNTAYMYNRTTADGARLSTTAAGDGQSRNPQAHLVGKKLHGIQRRALRALLADKDEIGRSAEGHRRFRSVTGDEETVITVDPQTELMVAQESRSPRGQSRATFKWARRGNKFVRERLEVEAVDYVDGQPHASRASVVITDLLIEGKQP